MPNLGKRHVESGKKGATPCSNTEHLPWKNPLGVLRIHAMGLLRGPPTFLEEVFNGKLTWGSKGPGPCHLPRVSTLMSSCVYHANEPTATLHAMST